MWARVFGSSDDGHVGTGGTFPVGELPKPVLIYLLTFLVGEKKRSNIVDLFSFGSCCKKVHHFFAQQRTWQLLCEYKGLKKEHIKFILQGKRMLSFL